MSDKPIEHRAQATRDREARALAALCQTMGLSPNRVLVIAAHAMAKEDAASAADALRRLADGIELLAATPAGSVN